MTEEKARDFIELGSRDGNFFADVTSEVYHKVDRASSTSLKSALKSGAHAQYTRNWPSLPSDAMRFGTMVHLMLELPEWRSKVEVIPKFNLRTNLGKQQKAEWLVEYGDRVPISSEQLNALLKIEKTCRSKPLLNSILDDARHEVSGFWDGQFDIKCKFRADVVTADNVLVDWKTCQDATRFKWDAMKYQYDVQAAFYLEGLSAILKEECRDFMFVAIESTPPYEVMIYHLDYESVVRGQKKVTEGLLTFKENEGLSNWRGYPDDVISLTL